MGSRSGPGVVSTNTDGFLPSNPDRCLHVVVAVSSFLLPTATPMERRAATVGTRWTHSPSAWRGAPNGI
jgi:hypothetical protein